MCLSAVFLHHLEKTTRNYCLLVFTAESSFQGFLGGAKRISQPSTAIKSTCSCCDEGTALRTFCRCISKLRRNPVTFLGADLPTGSRRPPRGCSKCTNLAEWKNGMLLSRTPIVMSPWVILGFLPPPKPASRRFGVSSHTRRCCGALCAPVACSGCGPRCRWRRRWQRRLVEFVESLTGQGCPAGGVASACPPQHAEKVVWALDGVSVVRSWLFTRSA